MDGFELTRPSTRRNERSPASDTVALPIDPLAGGGEMGALMRSIDWSQTPLGAVETWSPTLKMMVGFLLANRFPLLLWWGPQYASIYNDAYRPILGRKHPMSMGQPVSECWHEIWHVLKPLIDTPFNGGPATWMDDIELEINRHGFVEETHFTIAYSPVPDASAPRGIGGVLATVHEITQTVVGERRIVVLRDLGARSLAVAKTAEAACAATARILSKHPRDVPFALLYLLDPDGRHARLAGTAGVDPGQPISPVVIDLTSAVDGRLAADDVWPLAEAVRAGAAQIVEGLGSRFAHVPAGPWSDAPDTAVVAPIPSNIANRPAGVLVAGVSARLELDEPHRGFFELVTVQVATAIANARAHEEERRRAETLSALDRAKTAFFSNVSHEFRTPLALMLGPLEEALQRRDSMPADVHEELTVAHRNSLRLLKLVNTLLEFSRVEAGRIEAVYEPTDVAAYTAELASSFRSAIDRAGLRLTVTAPPLAEPVYVDRDMWEKIVLNLLSNALKHTFEGEIAVSVTAGPTHVELVVRDTGVGVAADQLPHLFERFHRVPNARSRTHEGTGIGLALVQELVRLHGGRVEVASEEGSGTAFTVQVPLGTAHLPSERIAAVREHPATALGAAPYVEEALRWMAGGIAIGGDDATDTESLAPFARAHAGVTVLVADDNADMRDYVARLLGAQGLNVVVAADGAGALAEAQARRPDLVLADIMMPGLDGFALLGALRSDPTTSDVPVILLSARAGEDSRIEGLKAGADDYLVKPFAARELLARVEAQLRRARAIAEEKQRLKEQDRLLAAVQAERARLREYFAQAPAAIAVLRGPEHTFEIVNDQYLELVGRRDVVGRRIRDAVPEFEGQGMLELLDDVYRTGVPFVGNQFRAMVDGDGDGVVEEHFYNFVYQPVREVDGSVSGIFVHVVEVSELVHARRTAEEAQAMAEDANRTKSEFLTAMSHELRTPLNAIAGHAQLIEMGVYGAVTDSQRDALDRIRRSQQHLLALINDVLNFAKLEAGRVEYSIEDVRLSEVVAEVLSMIEPQLAAKELAADVRVSEHATVRADREKVRQILLNLLSNAAKFTLAGGRVSVDTPTRDDGAAPAGTVLLRVADTGIGIPREKQEAIFDPFVQVHRNLTSTTEGTGLGLAISRDLARGMRGDLRVRSVEGEGSTFTLTLPR